MSTILLTPTLNCAIRTCFLTLQLTNPGNISINYPCILTFETKHFPPNVTFRGPSSIICLRWSHSHTIDHHCHIEPLGNKQIHVALHSVCILDSPNVASGQYTINYDLVVPLTTEDENEITAHLTFNLPFTLSNLGETGLTVVPLSDL